MCQQFYLQDECSSDVILQITAKIAELEAQNHKLNEMVKAAENENRQLMAMAGVDPVAFFTAFVSTGNTNYNAGETVIFDTIVTNFGNGYNPGLGVFICPITGYYLFSTTVNPADGFERVGVEIQLSGTGLVGTYADEFSAASTCVVTLCQSSQAVSVRVTHDDSDIYGTPQDRWSSFTGTFLSTL